MGISDFQGHIVICIKSISPYCNCPKCAKLKKEEVMKDEKPIASVAISGIGKPDTSR